MKNNNERVWLWGITGLVLGVLLTVYTTSNVLNSGNTGMMQMMGIRYQGNALGMVGTIDKHFIEEMIPHHQGAIDMALLARDRATEQEVKELAENIIKSQTQEIEQMKSWYKNWYGTEVPDEENETMGMGRGMMHGGMMGDEADITALEEAENFDKAFIEEMIPHHQMAVMMSNMLLSTTNRPEMKELGNNIVAAQTKEIDEMRRWYADWGY